VLQCKDLTCYTISRMWYFKQAKSVKREIL